MSVQIQKVTDYVETKRIYSSNVLDIVSMGDSGDLCMTEVFREISVDGDALKTYHLKCGSPLCPDCSTSWIISRVYEMTLRLEIEAKERGERPFPFIMSVPPSETTEWTIEEVNTSLFRRGYRRARNLGIDGGVAVWHPFRIKKCYQNELRNKGIEDKMTVGEHESKGMWDAVKEDKLNIGYYKGYLRIGMHTHCIGFGKNPIGHKKKDFFIGIKGSDGSPDRMNTDEVMKYLYYVLTHAGQLKGNMHTNPTRRWGCCFRKPDLSNYENVTEEWVEEKKHEIAEKLGMCYSEERGLYMPVEDEDEYEWMPIWMVGYLLKNEEKALEMDSRTRNFLFKLKDLIAEKKLAEYEKLKEEIPETITVLRDPKIEEIEKLEEKSASDTT